jgi:leader peptidase (prepilin peptidase) / N-methyltransferase
MNIEAIIFGLLVGSFLNVCIYRLPKNLSILGRSFCPTCHNPIPLYRNMPILTYMFQGGKSHCCKKPISIQYPLIEALTAVISLVTLWHSQTLPQYLLWFCLFMCPLIIISIIDFQLKIIPDVISIPFILIGVGVHFFEVYPDWLGALKFSGLGILVGGGSLWLIAEVISRLKKTDAMGGGDIKLSAMLGAFLGWKAIIFVFFSSSILALVYAVALRVSKRQDEDKTIPFGPFLSMGAIIYWLYGTLITNAYFLGMGFSRNPFLD